MSPDDALPITAIRVGRERWAKLGERVGDRNRSAVIRELIDWYLREPGTKTPVRPPAPDGHDPVS
jgi:hypothetical protein